MSGWRFRSAKAIRDRRQRVSRVTGELLYRPSGKNDSGWLVVPRAFKTDTWRFREGKICEAQREVNAGHVAHTLHGASRSALEKGTICASTSASDNVVNKQANTAKHMSTPAQLQYASEILQAWAGAVAICIGDFALVRASGRESTVELDNCKCLCKANGSDAAPYPRKVAACCIAGQGASLKMSKCHFTSSASLGRGILCSGRGSSVVAETCTFEDCGSSACWCREAGSVASLSDCTVFHCGGYGALYATNGGKLVLKSVSQQRNDHGYGLMVLHEGSQVEASGCTFNSNLWAGVGVRWSGRAHVEDCEICGNGAAGFQVRGSCMAAVQRINNREEGNYADPRFARVYINDPARTSVPSKGVPSRGVTRSSVSRALQ